jgi:hypothetical protein
VSPGEPTIALAPRSALGCIDGAFTLYRRHFVPLLGLSLFVEALDFVLAKLLPSEPDTLAPTVVAGLGGVLIGTFTSALGIAAVTRLVSGAVLGDRVGLAEMLEATGRHLPRLIVAGLFLSTAMVLGLLALVVPGVIVMLTWTFTSQAIVLEGGSVRGALARSAMLTRGLRGKIFGVYVLSIGIMFLSMTAFSLLAHLFVDAPPAALTDGLDALASALTLPLLYCADMLLYYDARIRKEGFDVQRLAEALGRVPRS